jgi:hypothetical protein
VEVAAGVGDVGASGQPVGVDGEVAEAGHGPWRGAGSDLGRVFVEGHIACPM